MIKSLKYAFVSFICISFCFFLNGQTIFHQDVFHGGVTAGGFSTGQGAGSGTINLHIEPGSTIRKAYLFSYTERYPPIAPITVNGVLYTFDTLSDRIMDVNYICPCATPTRLYVKDITADLIASPTSTFNITIPLQPNLPINAGWWTAFLYIEYENTTLPITSTTILINNQDLTGNEVYSINNLNPINTNFPVGFSIYTDRTGSGGIKTDIVKFNGNLLGVVGGSDAVNSGWGGAGVKGHFYYQNKTLFGLDDDTPDVFMDSTDGLADVSSYLSNNATSCNFELKHVNYPGQDASATNVNLAYFLTYSTPCDTFSVTVSNDTTICHGETLQLHASGGTKYEWSATSGGQAALNALSCTNCPNPVFSGDTSRVYTVRIWNTDSCSVVRPVRITVSPPLEKAQFGTSPAICGVKNNGRIFLSGAQPSLWDTLWAVNAGGDTLQTAGTTLSNLSPGDYTVFYTNSYGCSSADTVVNVGATIITEAAFDTHPDKGKAPLQVDVENLSSNATDYSWWLNGTYQGNNFSGFLADTSGTYHIQLIAWNNDSLCADTASLTVLVYDSLVTRIPNVFTPNGDGVNDHFTITVNIPVKTKLVILNRWGNVVHEWEGMLHEGQNVLWNGNSAGGLGKGSAKVSDGTYFYKLVFSDLPGKEKTRKATGYVEVLR